MIKHYLIYLTGILFVNGAGFLLIPVYATHLLPAEYGVLEVIYVCIDVFNIIFTAGMGISSLSIYSKERDEERKRIVISTATITALSIASLGCLLFYLSSEPLNSYFFGKSGNIYLFRIAGFYMLGQILCAVPMAFLQARMDSKIFILVSALQSLFIISMNIITVVYLNWRVEGILLSNFTGTAIFAFFLNAWTLKSVGYRFKLEYFRRLMVFGLPFIPGGLFLFAMSSADRFFLQVFTDSTSVGIYALGYKLGTVAGMFVLGPFMRVWGPYMFQIDRKEDRKERIGKYFIYLQSAYCMASLAIALFAPEIIRIISAPAYWEASRIVPYILFAYMCWTAAAFFDSGFYITEKTYYKPCILGATAAVITALYWLLIPRFGIMGSAYSAATGYCVFGILTYIFSRRIYPVQYPLGKFAMIVGCSGTLFYLGSAFSTGAAWGDIVLKGLVVAFYPVAILWLGIVNNEDVIEAKDQLYSVLISLKSNLTSRLEIQSPPS